MSPQTQAGASAGIGVVGSLFGAIGQIESGKQEEKAFAYNAEIDRLNTNNELVTNEQRYSQLVGKQATAYAASGVDITSGSPLLMMAVTSGRGGRQAAEIKQAGDESATLESFYGNLAAWRGKMAGVGTFLKGISSSAQGYLSATGYTPGKGDPSGMVVDG